jgi:hypothetical protein
VATAERIPEQEKVTFDAMRLAIVDAQTMIRAYDTKAQVLIAYLTFAVGTILSKLDDTYVAPWLLTIGIAGIITAFALCACVLYPRAPAKRLVPDPSFTPSNTYYLSPAMLDLPARELVERVRATDWLAELVYELRKLATIRQRKAYWFRLAFIITGISVVGLYAALLIAQMLNE